MDLSQSRVGHGRDEVPVIARAVGLSARCGSAVAVRRGQRAGVEQRVGESQRAEREQRESREGESCP